MRASSLLLTIVTVVLAVLVAATMVFAASGIVLGTDGNDLIRGNDVAPGKPAQVIYALPGDDKVFGGKGADVIFGGLGDDRLNAYHASADIVYGGVGNDRCTLGGDPETGATNDEAYGCETIIIREHQGRAAK